MSGKNKIKGLGLFLVIVLVGGYSFAQEVAQKTWRSQMNELSKAMSDIVPDLFSVGSLRDKSAFKNKTQKIYSLSKSIDQSSGHGVKTPDGDPTLPYISQLFREDIERAYHSLESGQTEYAKNILRSSVSYCIACHTRTQMGVQFPLLQAFSEQLKGASWYDRISFQAASRQFDTVYQEVMGQLKGGTKLAANPLELEKATKIALAISIRVKQNPQQALLLAKAVSASTLTSVNFKKHAEQWAVDLRSWEAEKNPIYKNDVALIDAARKLIGGQNTQDEPNWSQGEEVKYLRSSLLMHDLLRLYPSSPLIAEALYMIGLSYDVLHDLGVWSLHDMYYQACIEKKPHSALAQRCFGRYKDSITLGYSGSSGTHIPSSVQIHLSRLEGLAATSKGDSKK